MAKALVVDGNSLIYRVFYASYKQLEFYKNTGRQPTNALKLTLLILLKILKENQYDYCLVALDSSKKTLRHEEMADYKKDRKPMPLELVSQLPLIEEAVHALGMQTLKMDGIEADDIIGSFSKLMNGNQLEVDIYSSDKDMLQLVNDKTTVKLFRTGISDILTVTQNNFKEIFHDLAPHQVNDFKGISGDSSDNLEGVKGIGPVTASKLILEYGSLENIYNNLDNLSESIKSKFIASKEHALLCKKLSIIDSSLLENDS
ncbi:MAG: 5'-3' exonuclease, partial [Mycoplasmataceae bacterium]|nr:5'-3' exonuclease [Mycoplasmataceae bacterium]